jgi:elongation factor P
MITANKLKNGAVIGAKVDLTCRGDDVFKEPDFARRQVQYSYLDGDRCVFMDVETFDQYEIPVADLDDVLPYLPEGSEGAVALVIEGKVAAVQAPDVVVLELVECDPAVRGASATARTKPATTETGFVVQVPEYMEKGERVRVDTRTGKFVSRA